MATVLTPTRTDLLRQREQILARSRLSEDQLRQRSAQHQLSIEEYVILRELDEINYLLGGNAEDGDDN